MQSSLSCICICGTYIYIHKIEHLRIQGSGSRNFLSFLLISESNFLYKNFLHKKVGVGDSASQLSESCLVPSAGAGAVPSMVTWKPVTTKVAVRS